MSSFESPKPARSNSRAVASGKRPSLTHRCSDPEFSDSELDDAVDMGENAVWANLEEPIYSEKDVEIFRPTQEGSSLPIYYTKGWLPFSADTLFNTIMDIRYRKSWDNNVDDVHVVEHQHVSDVMYFALTLPWPLSNRDYVYRRRVKFYPTQNAFVVLYQGAHHADAPVNNTRVRVETCRLRLCIRNVSSSHDSCDFHFEYEDDTNFSLPNYVINMLLYTMIPSWMTKLQKACKGYADYFETINADGDGSMPSQVVRHRSLVPAEATPSVPESMNCTDKKNAIRAFVTEERKPVRQPLKGLFCRRTNSKALDQISVKEMEGRRSVIIDNQDAPCSEVPTPQSSGPSSFRHSMISDYGDHLHSSSSVHNFESQFSIASLSRSDCSRVSSVASAPTAPLDKDGVLMPLDDDFAVKFRKQKIGLHLETDLYSNKITVAFCNKNSEAAGSKQSIESGFLVTSVNGVSVSDFKLTNILSEIQRAKRPLTLGFSHPDREAFFDYRRFDKPQNVLQCLISRDNELLSSLRPLDEDAAVSAVLQRDFVARAVTSPTAKLAVSTSALLLSDPTPTSTLATSVLTDMERVLVPAGYLVYEINDSFVLDMPFAEIATLLQRPDDVCIVTFKAAMSIVGNKQRSSKGRHQLSKRFPGIFRKKHRAADAGMLATKSPTLSQEWAYERDTLGDPSCDTQAKQPFNANPEDSDLIDYFKVTVTSNNIDWVWHQVSKLKATERIFSAAALIDRLEAFLLDAEGIGATRVRRAMRDDEELIVHIKDRRDQGVKALKEFNESNEADDWQFGQTMLGVTTSWKPDEDGSIWIKLEGLVDGVDIFNTISVIREVDLYSVWIPFCSQSFLLQEMGHVELAAYLAISSPFLQRDAIIRAFGINAVYEHRCLLLLGESVDPSTITSSVPVPTLQGWNAGRMEIKGFRALIEPLTRMQARTCIVVNIDPKCAIPKAMLNFGIKKMAGILLYLIRKEAEKIERDQKTSRASAGNEHICRITNDPSGFYTWLRPIVDKFFRDQDEKKVADSSLVPLAANLEWTTSSTEPRESVCRKRRSTRISPCNGVQVSFPKLLSVDTLSLTTYHWSDYLYDLAIWPYVLLFFFAKMSAGLSFLYACGLKLVFTCLCTWLAVPGAFPRATRHWKRLHCEIEPLRRQYVVLAAICDVLSSYALRVWVYWIQCHVSAMIYGASYATLCFSRSPTEVRESERIYMILLCLLYASAIVAMQIRVAVYS